MNGSGTSRAFGPRDVFNVALPMILANVSVPLVGLAAEMKAQNEVSGKINGLLITSHNQDTEHFVTNVKHKYEDIITTQLHSRLENGKCLEVFILEGTAERANQMVKSLQTHKKIDYVKLLRA